METDDIRNEGGTMHPCDYYVRPKSKYPPMPNKDRAKQFVPFAALKGFEEAIAEVEQKNLQKNLQKNTGKQKSSEPE